MSRVSLVAAQEVTFHSVDWPHLLGQDAEVHLYRDALSISVSVKVSIPGRRSILWRMSAPRLAAFQAGGDFRRAFEPLAQVGIRRRDAERGGYD